MFIIRWWRYLRGFVVISLEGRGVERLLNLAVVRGISFWDLQKKREKALLSLSLASFRELRPLLRKARCRLHIHRKVGLPFIGYRLRRRRGLAAGVLLFIASLYLATSVVWYVRISGTARLEKAEVLAIVDEMGVRPGVWKRRLDLSELGEELPRRHSGIAWAGFELRGIVLEIEIVEHLPGIIPDRRPADIVASKDGLIERIVVIEGKAAVEAGDTVSEGDLLIEGTADFGNSVLDSEELQPPVREVRARGTVEARVWYEAAEPLKLEETSIKLTGASRSSCYVRWREKQLRLWGPTASPYSFAREEVRTTCWRWRNISFPVEVLRIAYLEQTAERKKIPHDEALQLAQKEARKKLRGLVPEGILFEQYYYQEYMENGAEWVRAVAETREDIGMVKLRRP